MTIPAPSLEPDRRGATALCALAVVALAPLLFFALTRVTYYDLAWVGADIGVALALLLAGVGRHLFGPDRAGAIVDLEAHRRDGGPSFARNARRVAALLIDGAVVGASALAIVILLEALPMDFDTGPRHDALGVDALALAWRTLGTSEAAATVGPLLAALVDGLYLLAPVAIAGATPGMLALGLRHVRASDGARPGALHGVLRVLAGHVLAPVQAAGLLGATFIAFISGFRPTRTIPLRRVGVARRTIADLVCRTETASVRGAAAAALAPAQEPPRPERRRRIRRRVAVLTGVVLLAAVGVALYRQVTRLDRALARFPYVDAETFDWLAERADDPRVHEAFLKYADDMASVRDTIGDSRRELEATSRAFERRRPPATDAFADTAVRVYAKFRFEKALGWAGHQDRIAAALERQTVILANDPMKWGISFNYGSAVEPAFATLADRLGSPLGPEAAQGFAALFAEYGLPGGTRRIASRRDDPGLARAFVRELDRRGRDPAARRYEVDRVADALAELEPEVTDEYLSALLAACAVHDSEACVERLQALAPTHGGRIRTIARAPAEPGLRLGSLVATCRAGAGGLDLLPAIIDAVEAGSPAGPAEGAALDTPSPADRHDRARRTLAGFGGAAKPDLLAGLDRRSRAAVGVCARALGDIDAAALMAEVDRRIDADARPEVARPSLGVVEVLLAVSAFPEGDDRVDFCLLHALSSRHPSVATYAARVLRGRLRGDRFVDVFFRFLARKESYNLRELNVYEDALIGAGDDARASAAIARNLGDLLAAEGGRAERVFWAQKLVGLRCLVAAGDESAYGVILQYAADSGSFEWTEPDTGRLIEAVSFRDLCEKALGAIELRTGKRAPPLPPR